MKGLLIQVATALIRNFLTGYNIAWSSHALEALESDDSPIHYKITKNEATWIACIPMVGSLISTFCTVWLADNIGRKRTEILCSLSFVLGWCIITTASYIIQIAIGRFVTGFAIGVHLVLSMTIVGETCQAKLSGTLTSLMVLMYIMGTLVSYITGWLCGYQVVNYLNLTLSVLFVVMMSLLKETPPFLVSKGKEKEALESLKFYRGVSKTTQDILMELAYMRNQNNCKSIGLDEESTKLNDKEVLSQEQHKDSTISPWKLLCTSKPIQRALVVTALSFLFLVFGGTIAVQAYAGPLFSKAAPGISRHMCSIVLSIAFVVGAVLSTLVSGLVGRRVLMISSAMASSGFLGILASLLKWQWGPEWLIPAAVLMYCCSFQTGVACVPFVQMSESFAPKMKSLIFVIAVGLMCIGNFIVLALFSPTVDHLGLDGTFLMFAFICAATAVVSFFFMKETKGLSVEEIEEMYARGYLYNR